MEGKWLDSKYISEVELPSTHAGSNAGVREREVSRILT